MALDELCSASSFAKATALGRLRRAVRELAISPQAASQALAGLKIF